jgi:hypothetical protein
MAAEAPSEAATTSAVRCARPTFSVVIAFYNQEEFARATLDSIVCQWDGEFEIIAVDDGSPDGTAEVLRAYGEPVRPVIHEVNRGASAARSSGAAAATGDYLVFLDGDDAFLPWAIDVYRTVVRDTAPVIVIGPMRWFVGELPEPGRPPDEIAFVAYDDYFAKDRAVGVSASALVFERGAYESVGGWGDHFPVDDYDLLCKLGTRPRVVQILDPPTTLHRGHGSQTIQNTELILDGMATLVRRERSGAYPGGLRRALARRACVGGSLLYWSAVAVRRGTYARPLALLLRNWTFVAAAVVSRLAAFVHGRSRPRVLTFESR